MSAIRQAGKINENTTLIDLGMENTYGMTALYLIRGEKTCLIDGGTHTEAPRLVKTLSGLDAFPPDLIIPTHPHHDHAQGIPFMRQEASRRGKPIQVLASQQAIPLLADASFNDVYNRGPYQSIQDVTPLKEGDVVDLGGISLRIYDVPGHCQGHIAILDEKNGDLFVGDSLGIKINDEIVFPPFMPPTWDPDAFLATVNKLRQIPYERLCLAHYGCIYGSEARSILDEVVENCNTWWQFFERHADKLDDTGYLLQAMRKELKPGVPEFRPVPFRLKVMLPVVSAVGALLGRRTAIFDKLAYSDALSWLATGYRMYTEAH